MFARLITPSSLSSCSTIVSVVQEGGQTVVTWRERIPSAKAIQRAQASSPYVIASIPAGSGPVVFRGIVDDPGNPYSAGNAFPIQKFLSGGHSLIKDEAFRMVNDESAIKDLWSVAFGAATPPPKADFGKYRYAAIFLGQRPTPGYEVVIQRIARIGPSRPEAVGRRSARLGRDA